MDKKLLDEAVKYGLNASMYNLLPAHKRESALRRDIEKIRKTKKGDK